MKKTKPTATYLNKNQLQLISRWLEDILVIEYKRDRLSTVSLSDMRDFLERVRENRE